MAGDRWSRAILDEIRAPSPGAIAIGPFGSRMKSDVYAPTGVPVVRGKNLGTTKSFVGDFVYVSPEFAAQLGNCNVFEGDLVFPHRGNIGEVGIVTGGPQAHYVLSTSMMKITVNKHRVDPCFLFYFFRSHQGRYELLKNASQVGTPGIATPLASLRSISLPLPALHEQRAIAVVLGALDDKIELNRRMCRTLEGIARAIFQSWFVDFDPVRAKAAGAKSFRGMPQAVFDTLPAAFTDSPLGPIPKGWRAGTLGEVANECRDSASPEEIAPGTPYIALEHMPRRSIALPDWGTSDGVASGKLRFKRGDILFGKLRPYFHKVGVAPLDGVCSTDIVVVRPASAEWFGFVLVHVSTDEFVAHTDRTSTGTKMPRTNWRDMSRYEVALPPAQLAEVYTRNVAPLIARMAVCIHTSRALAELRDALLPKLVSGELRIRDLERILGRSA